MRFADFEKAMSPDRMRRYVGAMSGDTRKAMTLYRLNLQATQELFSIISCFEIALRNAIDIHYLARNGADWLQKAVLPTGMFYTRKCANTVKLVTDVSIKLASFYTHPKLVAEMNFGFWRYLFADAQFRAGGQSLLAIFPAKPRSTPTTNYNHDYVFAALERLNNLRNRIAHHEPVCFQSGGAAVRDTAYARQHYAGIIALFNWMQIDEAALLYGLDHVIEVLDRIDRL